MIDPFNITDYNRTSTQLEEFLMFCVSVPGHNAKTTAAALDDFLGEDRSTPFELIRTLTDGPSIRQDDESLLGFGIRSVLDFRRLRIAVQESGIGCYTRVARSFWELAYSGLDLADCSVEDLEVIYGIGKKTSRFFEVHSRANARHAILDVHILRYLKSLGHNVPDHTPSGPAYDRIEQLFLAEADKSGRSVAEFDLNIWRMGAAG